jgi:hypothetical protein
VVLDANIVDDRFVHGVTRRADGAGVDDAAHGHHREVRGAAADVDDHRTARLGDRKARTERSRHRLLDKIDATQQARRCRGVGHVNECVRRAEIDGHVY